MKQYIDLLKKLIDTGELKNPARENMPKTKQLFCEKLEFDLQKGFPILTTKNVPLRIIFEELKWFLSGDTNIKTLLRNNVNIWNEDVYKFYVSRNKENHKSMEDWLSSFETSDDIDYDAGFLYGKMWRDFGKLEFMIDEESAIRIEGFDQIKYIINNILCNYNSRYKIVSAWNPQMAFMFENSLALPACHIMFQINISEEKYVDLAIIQRSCDVPLGVPFNIASYAMLIHIIAKLTNLEVGKLSWIGMDVHIYENQIETAKQQIEREIYELPTLKLNINDEQQKLIDICIRDKNYNSDNIDSFINNLNFENFELIDYKHHGKLAYPLSTGYDIKK